MDKEKQYFKEVGETTIDIIVVPPDVMHSNIGFQSIKRTNPVILCVEPECPICDTLEKLYRIAGMFNPIKEFEKPVFDCLENLLAEHPVPYEKPVPRKPWLKFVSSKVDKRRKKS